ncbi:thiamine/thiamine pyrophosphate ABC transporter permease ThiP [Vibrio nitrifigilis]|uniref:Thiamine transport system permease protein ThiP n=1 Tax=Vibrio nitrifigilis TaxID=2789781 RepID=A0ABS0GH18_9VIBR|nr:thiamine/thiamine pyrophosphate ABC transporter permease ThiP [Vibrio nitrifigilis]MBF9001702.1 thiamine/thiamine pyrophosphate ABC transporter permease ThiP [Vibrio nitrifigilis]
MNKIPKLGLIVGAFVVLFVLSAVVSLLRQAPLGYTSDAIWHDSYYLYVTWFSFYQACLSTAISLVLAIPVALALYRRQFWGRNVLLKLFSMTLVLPVLVAVFGLLAIYGRSGWLTELGITMPFQIYGLGGILLAHVFFNLPYSSRLILQSLQEIPEDQHKLCAHLGMSHWQKFRWVEWHRVRQQLPHIGGLVFMLCFTSFAAVMALGGGPKSTTIELAIYQAIKYDFDLQTGALLAIWQMILCSSLYFLLHYFARLEPVANGAIHSSMQWLRDGWRMKVWDGVWIVLVALLVMPPLVMVVVSGINDQLFSVLTTSAYWQALGTSVRVALLASITACISGLAILLSSRALRLQAKNGQANGLELIGTIILVTPGLVISTGLFLLLRQWIDVFSHAYWVVVLVNALMALPYVIKSLSQPLLHIEQQYRFLCASLGMKGWQRLRMVEMKALKVPLAQAFSLSFLLSMGDLSAIALFGNEDFRTLPLYLYQLLGSYQMKAAAVVSLTLLLFSVGVFYLVEKLFTWKKRSRAC